MRRYQRDFYHRRRNGIEAPTDLLPAAQAQTHLQALRDAGISWRAISRASGLDSSNLQRIHNQQRQYVTRYVAAQIAAVPLTAASRSTVFVDSGRARWMLHCLTARGWTSDLLGEALGWTERFKSSDLSPTITIDLQQRIETVFRDWHWRQGPSKTTMLRALRKGLLPADCYDWEHRPDDYRPVPGTLHPDLVVAAATFEKDPDGTKREQVLAMMQTLGQWPDQRCATAALRAWMPTTRAERAVQGPYCRDQSHNHRLLPAMWIDKSRAA